MEGNRDIIVIGGSTGAIDVVCRILDGLPNDLEAAIFIVVHMAPASPNFHVDIFQNHTELPVNYAADREPIELGRVYVAPADRHLLIKAGEVRVIHGPKENNFRPAIDPLFRSAATTYDGRVIGVVVTGALDDGTHGLMQIKRAGGTTIVQSPEEAVEPSMPTSAIRRMEIDYVLHTDEIGPVITDLVGQSTQVATTLGEDETDVSEGLVSALRLSKVGAPSMYTCPDCNGALWEIQDGNVIKFRCHVGHGFALDTLLMRQATEIEQALWSAVRGFEERAALQKRTANNAVNTREVRDRLLANSREQQQMADLVRSILMKPRQVDEINIGKAVEHEYGGDR
ncbi:MAG: chemotaxis protein CheB [Pirellulales bacterium]